MRIKLLQLSQHCSWWVAFVDLLMGPSWEDGDTQLEVKPPSTMAATSAKACPSVQGCIAWGEDQAPLSKLLQLFLL